MQQPYFLGDISINDNLRISEIFSKKSNKAIKKSLFKAFDLDQIKNRKVSLCSGGEKARANIIRGLLTCRPIILIDEPTAHLDAENSKRVAALLSRYAKRCIMIVTTHQPQFFHFSNSVFLAVDEGILKTNHDPA
jgi:ABC-type lipoprotein export system ATPase subunit